MPAANDGGLGEHIVGDKVLVGKRNLQIVDLLGEGGFSYAYLVDSEDANEKQEQQLVLKVTSIHSRSQRDIAEKEAKLLSKLSHPSIIKMYDTCYRQIAHTASKKKDDTGKAKERPQHLILMEFCEGGHALDVCNKLASSGQSFDLSTLIIAFGQICNAVSYLHAQRPPIVHRDLKPVNFLVKNGAYKLCDFGSAVFGHVDLKSPKARAEAEEVVQKTTTQMFRAPEMVDLYMNKKLTQSTDVWALGCCLYSMAFLKNCFEEGSNLAILSGKYTIPDDNPYGNGMVELLDRMLTMDCKERADMTEVILCLSALYSGRPLPPRKKKKSSSKEQSSSAQVENEEEENVEKRVGAFRTDGQGIQESTYDPTKATEGKKLASNSVAARRKRAAVASSVSAAPVEAKTEAKADAFASGEFAFSADFNDMQDFDSKGDTFFGSEDAFANSEISKSKKNTFETTFETGVWGEASREPEKEMTRKKKSSSSRKANIEGGMEGLDINDADKRTKKRSTSKPRRKPSRQKSSSAKGSEEDKKGVKKGKSFAKMFRKSEVE